ncbi:MAG: radical SAM protein [Candidatus Omnitrophica bacterium]|nr:radical SAM protein [Candidatus Omnitrophota bacterium]
MCHIWEKQNSVIEMDLQQIERLFQDPLLRNSLEIINLTGGEPTLRPDLQEIVKIILKNCSNLKRIDIPTNGINTDLVIDKIEQILAILFPTRKIELSVTVSIDGINGIYERVRNVPQGFNKVKQTIIGLKELANLYPYMSLGLNTVITKENYNYLIEILNFAQSIGLGLNFTLGAISEIGVESIKMRELFKLDEDKKEEVVKFIEILQNKNLISHRYAIFMRELLNNGRRILGCNFRQKRAVLLEPEGNLYLCGNFKKFFLGNVTQDNFAKIWQNDKFTKKDWLVCENCESNCYWE